MASYLCSFSYSSYVSFRNDSLFCRKSFQPQLTVSFLSALNCLNIIKVVFIHQLMH